MMLALLGKAIAFDALVLNIVAIAGGVDFVARVARCVLDVAHGLFDLSLYLLRCPFGLGPRIAGPLTDLALGTSGCIINGALNFITVHFILRLVGNESWILASGYIRRTDFVETSIGYLSGQ
jgi:hypothetical protein